MPIGSESIESAVSGRWLCGIQASRAVLMLTHPSNAPARDKHQREVAHTSYRWPAVLQFWTLH